MTTRFTFLSFFIIFPFHFHFSLAFLYFKIPKTTFGGVIAIETSQCGALSGLLRRKPIRPTVDRFGASRCWRFSEISLQVCLRYFFPFFTPSLPWKTYVSGYYSMMLYLFMGSDLCVKSILNWNEGIDGPPRYKAPFFLVFVFCA